MINLRQKSRKMLYIVLGIVSLALLSEGWPTIKKV